MSENSATQEKISVFEKRTCYFKYHSQVENLLREAWDYLAENPKKKSVVLKLPNLSSEFWIALEEISSEFKWSLYVSKVWYSEEKVRISTDERKFLGLF